MATYKALRGFDYPVSKTIRDRLRKKTFTGDRFTIEYQRVESGDIVELPEDVVKVLLRRAVVEKQTNE